MKYRVIERERYKRERDGIDRRELEKERKMRKRQKRDRKGRREIEKKIISKERHRERET